MEQIKNIIQSSIEVKEKILLDESLLKRTQEVAETIVKALRGGNRIYFCGNGGSAADAQHLAAEFSGRFYSPSWQSCPCRDGRRRLWTNARRRRRRPSIWRG